MGGQLDLVANDRALITVGGAFPSVALLHTTAAVLGATGEPLARRLLAAPAGVDTVGVDSTLLPGHIGAFQNTSLEAVLQSCHLRLVGCVRGVDELGHDAVVLTDAVAVHAAVVRNVGHAPLHINDVAGIVGRHHVAPAVLGVVPVGLQLVVGLHATGPHIRDGHTRLGEGTAARVRSVLSHVRHGLADDGCGIRHVSALLT
mmetsp:Transcript_7717/g.13020  ORF Transcript_7717/g.13020 Transcript_7717/m.13020 type:complete len:202 (-) Transcript_7717:117-722(-)